VAAIAAVTLTACTSSGRGSAGSTSSGAVKTGGTLVAALAGDPGTLDVAQNSGALTIFVGQNIFEQLFAMDKTSKPRPQLASGYVKSADDLTYTISLRTGITFQNGQAMTSADVVASLLRWEKVSGTGQSVGADVVSIAASGPDKVVITLKHPRYSLISDLAGNIQAAIIVPASDATAAGTKPMADSETIGTGPYKLKSYVHGQKIDLVKFTGYKPRTEDWGGLAGAKAANINTLEFRFVSDPTQQLNGLESGQFQWAQAVSPDTYDTIKTNSALNVQVSDTGQVYTFLLNHNAASPMSKLPARQALNMLIDKTAMATAAFGPKVLWSPLEGAMVLPSDGPLYSTAGENVFNTHDTAKAKQLFAEAGVTSSTPLRIYTTQTYSFFYQMAVVLQAELKSIGLNAKVEVYDYPTMNDRLTSDKTSWDISMAGFGGNVGSPSQILYLSPSWPGQYTSTKMTSLLSAYDNAQSDAQAKQIGGEIQQTIWDEIPVIAVAPSRFLLVSSSTLKNMSGYFPGIFWNAYRSS
jgi:peptide/nickel transport system substrate-binding protein